MAKKETSGATGKVKKLFIRPFRSEADLWIDFNSTNPQREEEKLDFLRKKIMFEATMDIRRILIMNYRNEIKELQNLLSKE